MRVPIVRSVAGRDKGRLQAVFAKEGEYLLVCDGKEHPINRPKRKNPKHLSFTTLTLGENQLKSNKSLRAALYKALHESD